MPDKETLERAERDKREGKSPSTQAGEFVREEMHHVREGKHGVRSTKQAIAIGLSKARRAGVDLPSPSANTATPEVREKAERDEAIGESGRQPSPRRARATRGALKREGRAGASHRALSRQAHSAARRRTRAQRSRTAKKAAATRKRSRS